MSQSIFSISSLKLSQHQTLLTGLRLLTGILAAFLVFIFIYSFFYYTYVEKQQTQFFDHVLWWLKSFGIWFVLSPLTLIGLYLFQTKLSFTINILAFGIPNIALAAGSRVYFDHPAYTDNIIGYYILFIPSQSAAFCFVALFWYWFIYQKDILHLQKSALDAINSDTESCLNQGLQVEYMGRTVKIPFDEIVYIKSAGNYIEVFSKDNEFLKRATLKDLHNELPDNFLQIHRSQIVNLKHINKLQNASSGVGIVTMSNHQQLNVSKALKSTLKKQLANYPLISKSSI